MNKLIVAEKPSVALRLASALSNNSARRNVLNGVSYYEINDGTDTLYVVAAVGHIFTIGQKERESGFPVFNVHWIESYKMNKNSYYTKKYLDVIGIVGKKCGFFINACDYDLEGTVIGTNIIKFLINGDVNREIGKENVKRMRFSTTTTADLLAAYQNLSEFDSSNFAAGETRHMLDWMWGINLSRALTRALLTNGVKKIMSIGRVQGPALAILAKREDEIKHFVPKPYWQIFIKTKGVEFINRKGDLFEKKVADDILAKSKAGKVIVESVEVTESKLRPYPPFDLTNLQLEASRTLRLDPSKTLSIAQSLYERAYISYPRTTSQKLPYALNLPRIIGELGKNERYKKIAESLINARMFRPAEGTKTDEAHPAIFPTGVQPKDLVGDEERLYDLIVKRFLACFGRYATAQKTIVVLDTNGEKYEAGGKLYTDKGWIELYEPYIKLDEYNMPKFEKGEDVKAEDIYTKELETKPPRRFTKATLIALLEKKELGTKATRSEIIETLFKREYIKNSIIEATDFGLSVYGALHEYCAEILDEELTRKLEEDMESISKGTAKEELVVNEGREMLVKIINKFKENETKIGASLAKGLKESEKAEALGRCPRDGGNLIVKRSRTGKMFVACSNWPSCTNTYPLPQGSKIVPKHTVCKYCGTPEVKVFRWGKRPFEMCLTPDCESKKDWGKKKEKVEIKVETAQQIKEKETVKKPKKAGAKKKVTKPKKKRKSRSKKSKEVVE